MASELRRWLQKHPHPHAVRGETSDGDERTVKLGVARSKWSDAEKALADCWKLEALDAEGNVLRVCDVEGVAGPKEEPNGKGPSLVELGRLLNESADRSAERHAEAYRLAYEQQRLLVEVLSARLQALEKAWHQLIMSQTPENADPNAPLVQTLLGLAIGGPMQAPGGGAPPNGKGQT